MQSSVIFVAAFALTATPVAAVPLSFTFNGGPVVYVEMSPFLPVPAQVVQDFVLGEDVMVSFTIDSATPDLDPTDQRAEYEDPLATITLTGATSGTTITTIPGLNLQFDSVSEFDVRNILVPPGPGVGEFGLYDDTDYRAGVPLFSDPDDLTSTMTELQALVDINGKFLFPNLDLGSLAIADTYDADFDFFPDVLEFGPVASVPLPAAGFLLLGGLGALRLRRRSV